ncbi:MAG: thiamine phosphate synthase [Treponema sp.]|nr:thiamine phosphate synthase [Treponema sp.]MEE3435557.1 thiamine phosphate synthase [Treponema sp.]
MKSDSAETAGKTETRGELESVAKTETGAASAANGCKPKIRAETINGCKPKMRAALRLYAVTDRHWLNGRTLVECVEQAIDGGATFVQLREKDLDEDSFLNEARALKKLCAARAVPFVVNDNVMIAKEVCADGVHVGQSDMACLEARRILGPDAIIGVSACTVEQALLAEKQGADYLGVGAVFATGSKADAESVSFETLKAICSAVKIPVVAIGGISAGNVHELKGSGIAGVSVISAIFANDDIRAATKILAGKVAEVF